MRHSGQKKAPCECESSARLDLDLEAADLVDRQDVLLWAGLRRLPQLVDQKRIRQNLAADDGVQPCSSAMPHISMKTAKPPPAAAAAVCSTGRATSDGSQPAVVCRKSKKHDSAAWVRQI